MTTATEMFPPIVTVDEIAAVLRWCDDGADTRKQRRKVYDLVRTGQLVPVGGTPADARRLSKALRFSADEVRRYIDGTA